MLATLRYLSSISVFPLLLAAGCGVETDLCSSGARTSVPSEDLRSALVAELTREEIPFSSSPEGEICYPSEWHEHVIDQLVRLDLEQRPPGRIEIAGLALATEVTKRLAEAGIEFRSETFENSVVITLDQPRDRPAAMNIIEATARDLFP